MKSGKPEKTRNSFRIPTLRKQIQLTLTMSLDEMQSLVKAIY